MDRSEIIINRDIIVVGQQSWEVEIGSNCKNLALEFSKNNRVLYINPPLDRVSRIRYKDSPQIKRYINIVKRKESGIVKIAENLWNVYPDEMIESINWIKNKKIHTLLNKINNNHFASSILRATQELGFKDYILFNDNDIFRCFYLKELLKPQVSIYYSRDYMIGVDYWKHHGERLEPLLIEKSDVCIANSTYLANYCKQYNPNSYYVGQGCDLSIFTNYNNDSLPKDISSIAKPIIGYVGALQSIRLDIALLENIAKEKPEWNIVLVGPEDREFAASNLHQYSNIHFLGSKDPAMLPAYISGFDVCLNPQLVNQITIGNYPRKIDEYLAMGKPVVATSTDAMGAFKDQVYLAEDKNSYISLITQALNEDSVELREKRIAFASTHTWENNIKEIYSAIIQTTMPVVETV